MKLIKKPSTIKMKRLLLHFMECDVRNHVTMRELQEDAKRLLAIDPDLPPGRRKPVPAASKKKAVRKVLKKRPRRAATNVKRKRASSGRVARKRTRR